MNRQMSTLNYSALVSETHESGGFTVALDGTKPDSGYAVSIGRTSTVPLSRLHKGHLYRFVIDNGRALRDPGAHFGAWVDNGLVHLDVSYVLPDRQSAEILAAASRQRAIYDLAARETIPVERTRVLRHAGLGI